MTIMKKIKPSSEHALFKKNHIAMVLFGSGLLILNTLNANFAFAQQNTSKNIALKTLDTHNLDSSNKANKIHKTNKTPILKTEVDVIYDILTSELIVQSQPLLVLNKYIELARLFNDAKIAERATQIAIDNNQWGKANEAAGIWQKNIADEQKFNLYRTLAYLNFQGKNYTKSAEYIDLWLDNIPKNNDKDSSEDINTKKVTKADKIDKFAQEVQKIPELIRITDPVIANKIADKLLSFSHLEAKLSAVKILLQAKQNRGIELASQFKQKYQNNHALYFTWLTTLPVNKQIEDLNQYILIQETRLKNSKESAKLISATATSGAIQTESNTEQDEHDNEEDLINDATNPEKNLRRAHMSLLNLYFVVNNFSQGQQHAQNLLRQYPDDVDYSFMLAQFYRVQKNNDKAYKTIISLSEYHNSLPEAMYVFLADISKDDKQYEVAASWLEKVNIDNATALKEIASLYLQAQKFDKAHQYYDLLRNKIKDKKDVADYDVLMLKLWITTGQWNYALEILNNMEKIDPKAPEIYSIRSDVYLAMNNLEAAEIDLKKLIEMDAEFSPNALNSLAYLYAQKNINLDIALSYITKALAKNPNDYAYQDTMGFILYKKGRLDDAKKWLEQSWNTKADPESGAHLKQVLLDLGQKEAADALDKEVNAITPKIKNNIPKQESKDAVKIENKEIKTIENIENKTMDKK